MDIATPRRPVSPPAAGDIRLIVEDGYLRAIDSNGRKMRLQVEAGVPYLAAKAGGPVLTGTTIAADDTVTIGLVEYVFVAELTDPPAPHEVLVGVSDSASLDNLIAAINGAAGEGTTYGEGTVAHPLVVASAGAGDTMGIDARAVGPDGNIPVSSSLTAGSWSAAALSGGRFATEASAGDQMQEATNLYTAIQDITKTSEEGWSVAAMTEL